jgi:adenosylmethionine-8-amino-7-oxononanoate aminotransferase
MSGATLGAVAPPEGYLQQVAEISKRHGLVLIADEIMTGCGRTGRNFACEHWGVTPDLLVVAKGLSSGYAPLGAVIASAKVVEAIARGSGTFIHGFTYNAHPVAVAAGHAVLRHMKSQKLVARAQQLEAKMRSALGSLLDLPAVGDVRGRGLLWGVEFVADKASKRPFERARNFAGRLAQSAAAKGLMLYPMQGCVDGESGDHLLIAPPAVITEDEIDRAVAQLRAVIQSAF